MKAVADTRGVAGFNLAERRAKLARPRGPCRKAKDRALLPAIRKIVDERPSYGYRRITVMVNRRLRAEGKPVVNRTRVLWIMQAHGLTLECHRLGSLADHLHRYGPLRDRPLNPRLH